MDWRTSGLILAWLAIAVLAFALAGLLRTVRLLLLRQIPDSVHLGPPIGAPIPDTIVRHLPTQGEPHRQRFLLVFATPDCDICGQVLPEIQRRLGSRRWAVVSSSSEGYDFPYVAAPVITGQREAFESLDVRITPFAVVVDPEGRVVDAAPLGSRAIARSFLDRLLASSTTDALFEVSPQKGDGDG